MSGKRKKKVPVMKRVFNYSEPTPPEGEAVPEQKCERCDRPSKYKAAKFDADKGCWIHWTHPPFLGWNVCSAKSKLIGNKWVGEPAPVVSTAAPEPPCSECATLRKERDEAEKAIAKALRFTPSEEEPEECAPWMVEAEPEPMGPFSLIEAITAMMEMFDREFSKADKRAEAAEAQLSTLKDALESTRSRLLEVAGHTNGMIVRLERELAEIVAPTPEVAKE